MTMISSGNEGRSVIRIGAGNRGWLTSCTGAGRSALGGLSEFARRAFSLLVARRQERTARAELHALDARMLKDIGITRGEIGHITRQARDGKLHAGKQRRRPSMIINL